MGFTVRTEYRAPTSTPVSFYDILLSNLVLDLSEFFLAAACAWNSRSYPTAEIVVVLRLLVFALTTDQHVKDNTVKAAQQETKASNHDFGG